jgi:hypothetical protein
MLNPQPERKAKRDAMKEQARQQEEEPKGIKRGKRYLKHTESKINRTE